MGGLSLDPDEMRQLGYRTVDALVTALTDPDARPIRRGTPDELKALVAGPPSEAGEPYNDVLAHLLDNVLPFRSRGEHPGFFAFIPFAGTWPGALGDFVASASNIFAGSWMESAGASAIELEVLSWFSEWVGYPSTAEGVLVSGGSAANMTALACARSGAETDDVVGYVSDQAHSSIARAARVLGLGPDQLRVLPSGPDHRLHPETLRTAVAADLSARRRPLFVVASGGATNTGVVDPLRELRAVCSEHDLWLHVDAAYGGFAALTERGRRALDGLELADSISLDPHKWLYQPYECGCLLVREAGLLERAFAIEPHYLEDARADGGEVNFSDRGLQLTRSARALKVWLSLRTFGLGAFREAIDRCLDLAEHTRTRASESDRLELLGGDLGIACFRRVSPGADEEQLERLNAGLVKALEESGIGLVSSTRISGRYAIRLCVLGYASTREDVDRVLDFLEHAEPTDAHAPPYNRDGDVGLTALAGVGTTLTVSAGEIVVAKGETGRDFYVVEAGEVDVYVDDEHVRTLRPGEFFGELAALDWGAGYGYLRTGTVVATQPATLRRISGKQLNELVSNVPEVGRAIRAAVRERLPKR